jgi:hypothetical protein
MLKMVIETNRVSINEGESDGRTHGSRDGNNDKVTLFSFLILGLSKKHK